MNSEEILASFEEFEPQPEAEIPFDPGPTPQLFPNELPLPLPPSAEVLQLGIVDYDLLRNSLELVRQQAALAMLQVEILQRTHTKLTKFYNEAHDAVTE